MTRHTDAIRRALWPPLAAIAALAILLVGQVTSLVSELHRVDASSQVVARSDRLQRLLIDMETGQRGYLIGGDPRFLEPYRHALAEIDPSFRSMNAALATQPDQQQRVKAIHASYQRWADEARAEMAVRQRGGNYAVYFNQARGRRLMDGLRRQIDDLIDRERATRRLRLADAQHQSSSLLYFAGVSTLLIGALLTWTTRRAILTLSSQYGDALAAEQTARDSLGATLISIGDGVLVTDAAGRVTMLNPVAEQLTGWTSAEAMGKEANVVFDIIHAETRETIESPVTRALREGRSVGLADATILRRRNGAGEIPIEDSGAPIRDTRVVANSALKGVVLVFRDVSERKRQEAALAEAAARTTHIAETLQQSLLLTPAPDDFAGLEVATRYAPALTEAQLGGDFFDVFAVSERSVAIVVGDVTGKGLAAASFTAEAKFALRAMLREQPDPATALLRLNRFLIDSHHFDRRDESTLIALSLGVVDTWTGIVAVAVAGCEAPLIVPAGASVPPISIDAGGPLIGVEPASEYEAVEAHLAPGDHLLFLTDGITEARRGRALFGIDGVVDHLETCPRETAAHIADSLLDAARTFSSAGLSDDACLVVVRRLPDAPVNSGS